MIDQLSQSASILVVDDDREILGLISDFLCKHGFRIDTAERAAQAEEKIQSQRVDLIILDVMMPEEDGLAFCRRIRTDSQIPIIMLTALGEETDRIVGLELGADDYLPKPFNPRELLVINTVQNMK